jgi:hypothetical protein
MATAKKINVCVNWIWQYEEAPALVLITAFLHESYINGVINFFKKRYPSKTSIFDVSFYSANTVKSK